MATGGINPTTGGISPTPDSKRAPKQELGKNEFLQILSVQLSNQDPLQPMEDTDFIAQMAQFSSLEQMSELNKSFSTSQAYSLIGKNVVGTVSDDNGSTQTILGRVTGIARQGGVDYLQVGSYYLPLGAVAEIYDTGIDANSLITQSANMIGKQVKATVPEQVKDPVTGQMITKNVEVSGEVEAIIVKDGTIYAKLKDTDTMKGKEVPVSYVTEISDIKQGDGDVSE